MTRTLTARFDGHALIPEEPEDLPIGTSLQLTYNSDSERPPVLSDPNLSIDEKLASLREWFPMAVRVGTVSDESLRRENLYGDDGR